MCVCNIVCIKMSSLSRECVLNFWFCVYKSVCINVSTHQRILPSLLVCMRVSVHQHVLIFWCVYFLLFVYDKVCINVYSLYTRWCVCTRWCVSMFPHCTHTDVCVKNGVKQRILPFWCMFTSSCVSQYLRLDACAHLLRAFPFWCMHDWRGRIRYSTSGFFVFLCSAYMSFHAFRKGVLDTSWFFLQYVIS